MKTCINKSFVSALLVIADGQSIFPLKPTLIHLRFGRRFCRVGS
jgi:hypothetical protein